MNIMNIISIKTKLCIIIFSVLWMSPLQSGLQYYQMSPPQLPHLIPTPFCTLLLATYYHLRVSYERDHFYRRLKLICRSAFKPWPSLRVDSAFWNDDRSSVTRMRRDIYLHSFSLERVNTRGVEITCVPTGAFLTFAGETSRIQTLSHASLTVKLISTPFYVTTQM